MQLLNAQSWCCSLEHPNRPPQQEEVTLTVVDHTVVSLFEAWLSWKKIKNLQQQNCYQALRQLATFHHVCQSVMLPLLPIRAGTNVTWL